MLRAATVTVVNDCFPSQVEIFYNDEHALTLGVRQVQVKTTSGTTTTNYPISALSTDPCSAMNPQVGSTVASGDQAGTDVSGRPMFPALFITDITNNPPNPYAGDWQYGGTGIPPTAVFGTWKGAARTVDKTKNPTVITVTPDADPAANNWNLGPGSDPVPPGLTNEGYGVEVRWDISQLGLQSGHTYRLYVIVHDGDQNHTGGDSGQMCAYITMPSFTPTPTPTASPTPTATSTPTPTAPPIAVTGKTFATKTVQITFQNNTGVAQVLTALAITWPQATNGNLQSIKMGSTTIYNTSTGRGSLNTSSLLGTNPQRTINAGSSATLTFTFQNNANTNANNYTGSATFNPFGTVTMLP